MCPQYRHMTKVPAGACGVFSLTGAAEFPLHPICRLHRTPAAKLLDQPCEFQQIRYAEERTLLADDELRVRSNEIRPLRWNRADSNIIDAQQETSAITVVPLAYARE